MARLPPALHRLELLLLRRGQNRVELPERLCAKRGKLDHGSGLSLGELVKLICRLARFSRAHQCLPSLLQLCAKRLRLRAQILENAARLLALRVGEV